MYRGSTWNENDLPAYARTGEVDALDGFVMALSPWAVQQSSLRRVARGAPRLRLRHLPAGTRGGQEGGHREPSSHPPSFAELLKDPESWKLAHARVAEKWDGRIRASGRARRLEGASAPGGGRRAPRTMRNRATGLQRDAKLQMMERELEDIKRSTSWS